MNKIFKEIGASVYFETSDGVKFYKEQDAKSYAYKLENKQVLRVEKGKTKEAKPSVEDRIKNIEAMTSIDDVKKALEGEEAKTVIQAGEAMIELLKEKELPF